MKMYRQGDVLLVQTSAVIPADAVRVPREDGRAVLAHGEVTGHSHAIAHKAATLFALPDGQRMLQITARDTQRVELRHEEHGKIELPSANYRVVIQREYVPGELPRAVAD